MVNSIVLVGNITRDAELRYFGNGSAMVKFSLAQNRKKKQGEDWIDEAMYFDVQYGGKGAEGVHKYLIKGKSVAVQGELRQERWEQDGQKRSKVLISAFEVQLLGSRPDAGQPAEANPIHDADFKDDIPF